MNKLTIVQMTAALLFAAGTTAVQAGTSAAESDIGRLQAPLAASFRIAETGTSTPKRYVISRDTQDLARWAASDKPSRTAIFARRNARGAIEIQSIAVLANDARAHALPDWKPSASLSLSQPGTAESELFAAVRKLQTTDSQPEVLSYDQMLTRIHAYKGVVALVSASPGSTAATLAFIPDTVNIAVTGKSDAVSSTTAASTAAGANSSAQQAAQGEIISSKPGEIVRMIRDENGNPAQLQFEVDPSQFSAISANPS